MGGFWISRISCGRSRSLAGRPGVQQQLRDEDVLARLHRIGGDAGEAEQGGGRGGDLLRQLLARHLRLGGGEGAEDRQRQAGLAARRVDALVRRRLEAGDALRRLDRVLQPLAPGGGQSARRTAAGDSPLRLGVVLVEPLLVTGCGSRSGNWRSRLVRSPLGSMMTQGMPSMAASSRRLMHRPVLPEPVMPTTTPCVVRSRASYMTNLSGRTAFLARSYSRPR